MSSDQNADLNTSNKIFKLEQGAVIYQNYIHEEIKNRLNSVNVITSSDSFVASSTIQVA
jgi:hypothetical protein